MNWTGWKTDKVCEFCGERATRRTSDGVLLCDSCFRDDDEDDIGEDVQNE